VCAGAGEQCGLAAMADQGRLLTPRPCCRPGPTSTAHRSFESCIQAARSARIAILSNGPSSPAHLPPGSPHRPARAEDEERAKASLRLMPQLGPRPASRENNRPRWPARQHSLNATRSKALAKDSRRTAAHRSGGRTLMSKASGSSRTGASGSAIPSGQAGRFVRQLGIEARVPMPPATKVDTAVGNQTRR